MSQKDILKDWFKEMPRKQAPADFSNKSHETRDVGMDA